MESKELRLAKRIVNILKKEDYRDAMRALKLVGLLLPQPRKGKKEDAEVDPTKGDLIPADEELMKFSKVMGAAVPTPRENSEETE